ncbi:hypothetical protein EB796_021221 [Bugula neritina]|uniref:Uncharacterized protein n=1 Tax=Bugula neritina TaxID=10212 RepID=A0A7J7J2Y9_BUGNE|nr:hypothetical protein EB796_021221 [Bugula neritina]
MLKELQAENISLKRRLKEESAARLAAEDRALELARENRRLQTQLRHASHTDAAGDEELFTQIEAAFAKFNQFLDVVRDTGLGHLIQEAGLDTFAGTSSPIPAPLQSQSPRQPNISHSYSDYVLKRQIALQSDDIIKPTPDSDSPKKTYSEIMTDGNVLALAAAVRSAEQAEAFVESPTKAKKKRKDKSKADGKSEAAEMITESALSPGTFKIKAFELKDVSELETPKLTPRATAAVDVMKSTEGFPDLPDDLIEEDKSSGRLSSGADKQTSFSSKQAPASGKQAPAELISSRETDTGRLQSTLISEAPGDADGYSSNDFVSVTGSKDESSAAGEVIHLSEPELSAISYTSSTDRDGKSELVNIKSLSELGSSVEDISASNNN